MTTKTSTVKIVGVVLRHASGYGSQDELWTLQVELAAWRHPDGQLVQTPLHVYMPNLQSHETLTDFMGSIHPYDVLRMRGCLKLERAEWPMADVEEMLGKDSSDEQLNQLARQLKEPVTVVHPNLGIFTLNREYNSYETDIEWNSQKVALSLSLGGSDPYEILVQTAETLWKTQKKWHQRVCDFAVQELLDNFNDTWLQEGEKTLSAQQFMKRIKLDCIAISQDSSFVFTFDDGDLFGSHIIQISGTLAQGPTHADIAG
jgi:hypothetical protein